jgi:single-strand DNA-binding protein
MNVGTFAGRIGRDAELRHASNGDSVSNFSLAVDVGTRANKRTLWVDCVLWGKRAEALTPYLLKGGKVTVHGRIDLSEYQKKDGTPGAKLQVTVQEVDLHGGSETASDDAPAPAPSRTAPRPSAPPKSKAAQPEFDDDLDDVPF